MKRFVAVVTFAVLAAVAPVLAAQPAHEPSGTAESAHHEGGDPDLPWKVANFAILAFGLGYLIYKHAGGFFRSRTATIRRGIEESARLKADADARYAEMEQRLAQLGAEIENLRTQAGQESKTEAERVREETAREIAKVQAQSEQEIESVAKTARQELRNYAADLAVDLAERKIREQLTPDADSTLLNAMLNDLKGRPGAPSVRAS